MKTNTLLASMFIVGAGLLSPATALASVEDAYGLTIPVTDTDPVATEGDGSYETARRGRGRGRGGDRDRSRDRDRDRDDDRRGRSDDRRDDRGRDDSSGRDRPRVPGGSGCDDPGDRAEHPECRV